MATIRYGQSRLRPSHTLTGFLPSFRPARIPVSSTNGQQIRHATFINRPRRPYTFTQLIQLSDGSTYTARTTSPNPLYRPAKDTRNTLTWQPSDKTLHNVELDEAGRLASFRQRFGHSFDAARGAAKDEEAGAAHQDTDDFSDLITGYVSGDAAASMKDSAKKPSTKK